MPKLSVGQTITRAYGFLFRRFFAIVGLSWIPATLLGASAWYWMTKLGAEMAESQTIPSDTRLYYLYGSGALMTVVVSFFAATIAVPLAQDAIGVRRETVAAHFVVGGRELRLFFAMLRFYVLVLAAVFLFAAAFGFAARFGLAQAHLAAGKAAWHGIAFTTLIAAVTALLAVTLAIFLSLRLSFFLMPFAAAERHVGLAHAWSLSRGQSGRLLLVSLILALPVDLLARGIEYAMFGAEFRVAMGAHAIYAAMASHAPVLAAIGTVTATVLIALFAGASGAAYRALIPENGESVAVEHRVREIPAIAPSPFMEPAFAKAPQEILSAEAPPPAIEHVEPAAAVPEDAVSLEPAIITPLTEDAAAPVVEEAAPGVAAETQTESSPAPAVDATTVEEAPLPVHEPLPDTVVAPEAASTAHEASDEDAHAMATPNRDADLDIGTSHDDPFSFPLRAPETPPQQHDAAA